jgi:hypothetical protein
MAIATSASWRNRTSREPSSAADYSLPPIGTWFWEPKTRTFALGKEDGAGPCKGMCSPIVNTLTDSKRIRDSARVTSAAVPGGGCCLPTPYLVPENSDHIILVTGPPSYKYLARNQRPQLDCHIPQQQFICSSCTTEILFEPRGADQLPSNTRQRGQEAPCADYAITADRQISQIKTPAPGHIHEQ